MGRDALAQPLSRLSAKELAVLATGTIPRFAKTFLILVDNLD
ncbi:MAG: hypothetical protein NZ651_01130 [Candidatus Bipolaricaulota bacterium]|nr:hypothetical protein [Candidatus Bipolaricaulota bacterium]MDW8126371.1 hypothetical protein [Candidatus Bipolaricaulota bacterium]